MPKQHAFLAVYAGETVCSAKLLAATADPALVNLVVEKLLRTPACPSDQVTDAIETGRRNALRLVVSDEEGANRA